MPYRLDTHVLTVDANVIHKVDTGNPANLFSMWTVFSRCADSVEQGRRLENLSWRLWQREQFVENGSRPVPFTAPEAITSTQALPQNVFSDAKVPEVPQLSGSVESLQDDEAVEFTSVSAPLEIRPRIRRLDSSASSRSRRERHISSDDFEKMIVSIVKDKAPLSAPTQTSVMMAPQKKLHLPIPPSFERSGSTTTESQSPSKNSDQRSETSQPSPLVQQATNVVRGFSPARVSVFPQNNQASPSDIAIPVPSASPAPRLVQPKKQPAKFALGGSCSPEEPEQSVDSLKPVPAAVAKKSMFQIGGSSEEEGSLKSAFLSPRLASGVAAPKKQTSFSSHVATHTIAQNEAVVDSDTEYVDESAIDDDDDSSDWEDSVEDSGKSSVDEKFFQRVPSKANLTSRPSLITLMLAQNERAKNLGNHASQSTSAIPRSRAGPSVPSLGGSPNDSDEAPLMMKGIRHPALKPISEVPRSNAQPIAVAVNRVSAQAALSPRTTRRNMLATELTESLRRHLLWERSQKSSTANAVLKRRHTSHDVANLKQYPERACMKKAEDDDATSWNQYFSKEALNGYHSKGW
ncbi:hypothetical protein HIM_09453 [Hirsutella minnesotensis 3608]|uniref:Uncharacterized protein n=1 Tax=Hirsutella minnesotensis 3608 TaxID=1043627 RepID=A0A0F8A338_9HYPO|nr:hypothetical protein HIM_09453 [Hirsutella minnesotensis 3608]